MTAGVDPIGTSTSLTTVTYPPGLEASAKAAARAVPGALVAASTTVRQMTLTQGTDGVRVLTSSAPPSAPASASTSFTSSSCIN